MSDTRNRITTQIPTNLQEQIAICLAMEDYLAGTVEVIDAAGYHPESNVACCVRVFNKAMNIRLGHHINYDVDRVPVFLANRLRDAGKHPGPRAERDASINWGFRPRKSGPVPETCCAGTEFHSLDCPVARDTRCKR